MISHGQALVSWGRKLAEREKDRYEWMMRAQFSNAFIPWPVIRFIIFTISYIKHKNEDWLTLEKNST